MNSFIEHPNFQANGFERNLIEDVLIAQGSLKHNDLRKLTVSQSGQTFYFTGLDPNELIQTGEMLDKKRILHLGIDTVNMIKNFTPVYSTTIDSPSITLLAGNVACIVDCNLYYGTPTFYWQKFKFSTGVRISENAVIIRSSDNPDHVELFYKSNLAGDSVEVENRISDWVSDGGFSTSGTMLYNESDGCIYYVNFFNNEFLCVDTNLNLVYRGKTIDTFSGYQVEAKTIKVGSKKAFTLASPPVIVNASAAVSDRWLFINSRIKADNESSPEFVGNYVIDIYELKTGKYYASFYIPKITDKKLASFYVYEDFLIAIFNDQVIKYKLRF